METKTGGLRGVHRSLNRQGADAAPCSPHDALSSFESQSLTDYGVTTLATLTRRCRFGTQGQQIAVETLSELMSRWGSRAIGRKPAWHSDVCADGSPIEFSIAQTADQWPEVRVLVEPLSAEPTLGAMQGAARETTEFLEHRWHVNLDRFRAIEDLFLPSDPEGNFAIMHGVCFSADKPPAFKLYLNPGACGDDRREELVAEALRRLGFEHAWDSVARFVRQTGSGRVVYLSLDLTHSRSARVKVYFRHQALDPWVLDRAMLIAQGHQVGVLEAFCREITCHQGVFDAQQLVSHLSFTDESSTRPSEATFYAPLWTYTDSDAQSYDRIFDALEKLELSTWAYEEALHTIARRPLAEGRGIHTYIGAKFSKGALRLTSYFSPEFYDKAPKCRYRHTG